MDRTPGFFTSISSNGTSNPIIWALSRPSSTDLSIYLYAFNPDSGTTMKTLFTGPAGTWPNLGGNANLVPVVANGQVLVASHNQLEIFGLTGTVTDTAVTSNPNPSAYGGSVTLTATVNPKTTGTPTGTVEFQDGTTTLGTATLSAGSANFTIATLSAGVHSIRAVYSGDTNFVTSASPVFVQIVSPAASSTKLNFDAKSFAVPSDHRAQSDGNVRERRDTHWKRYVQGRPQQYWNARPHLGCSQPIGFEPERPLALDHRSLRWKPELWRQHVLAGKSNGQQGDDDNDACFNSESINWRNSGDLHRHGGGCIWRESYRQRDLEGWNHPHRNSGGERDDASGYICHLHIVRWDAQHHCHVCWRRRLRP